MRPSPLLAVLSPVLIAGCSLESSTTYSNSGTPINCETLATGLAAAAPTLTATASGLQYRDQVVGTGATVAAGQRVSVYYSGCLTDGTKFAELNDAFTPWVFTLGTGKAVAGFEEGLLGMKAGGRRQLVVPPALGYGSNPPSNSGITASDTLVFTVDLIATQ
jgi:peptidylprolyl isomerase